VDIPKNGKLDLKENVPHDLDWVVASVHAAFDLNEKQTNARALPAVQSGVAQCIGHPLGQHHQKARTGENQCRQALRSLATSFSMRQGSPTRAYDRLKNELIEITPPRSQGSEGSAREAP
jgi:histidinol phosphatase-like PHP family hydrolase